MFRIRFRFEKTGCTRWLSHLEVMRAFERAVRRADLAYAVTQGFNPRMRLAFGPALPVGTAGADEYVDLWVRSFVAPDAVLERLRLASVPSLAPIATAYISDSEPSLSAVLQLATYETHIVGLPLDAVSSAIDALVASGVLEVAAKKGVRVFDLRETLVVAPTTESMPADAESEEGACRVAMTVRIGERGSMRPEALIRAALDGAGVVGGRLMTTRTKLEMATDEGPSSPLPS